MARSGRHRAWAVIPARGGSKGIAGKNLRRIQGRSLVARCVEAARFAKSLERVFVSTDDPAIAAAAREAGAEIVERPASLAGDSASSESALLHALDVAGVRGEALPELLVFLQCTAPFLSAGDIDGTVAALLDRAADTAFAAAPQHGFLWRAGEGDAVGVNHEKAERARRQDRAPELIEAGSVYVMRIDGFLEARHRFFGRTVAHEVPALRLLEIDTPDDLARARLLAPLLEPALRAPAIPRPLGGLVFDFDGVMTDDRVVQDENGVESVFCSRADGFGIEQLRQAGVPVAVLSREHNPVVRARCRKLGIECIAGSGNKRDDFRALAVRWGSAVESLVYVGNDLADRDCVREAGLGVAVADAAAELKADADLVLARPGGHGAVRELCDIVLAALRSRG